MEREITIRFSHIDGAGIVFYPRYFEMLSELFAHLPFAEAPFAIQTDFLKPNYLGDQVDISYDNNDPPGDWAFTGRIGDKKHFSIASLAQEQSELDAAAHRPDNPAFQSDAMPIAPWTTDFTGYLQVSRFYELINVAVEQWFSRTLESSFHELHTLDRGVPTVLMRTRCRELPRAGDSIRIWIRPTAIGETSLHYTSWLVRGKECLLENEQIIVFVESNGRQFRPIPIPEHTLARLQEQYVAA